MSQLLSSLFTGAQPENVAVDCWRRLSESPLPIHWANEHLQIYNAVADYHDQYGRPPSLDDVRDRLSKKALATLEDTVAGMRPLDSISYQAKIDATVETQRRSELSALSELVAGILTEPTEIREETSPGIYETRSLYGSEDAKAYFKRETERIDQEWPPPVSENLWVPSTVVTESEQSYLHYPFLAEGQLTLLEGDGGVGKSTVATAIAASLTRGHSLIGFEGVEVSEPRDVIWITTEEDVSTATRPRLRIAGADLDRVYFVRSGKKWTTAKMADLLQLAAKLERPPLVVLDAIKDMLGPDVEDYVETSVRRALEPLTTTAHLHGITFLGIRHWRKGSGSASQRGAGSMAWRNVAHGTLVCGRKDDALYLVPSKLRSAPIKSAWEYAIESVEEPGRRHPLPRLRWVGEDVHVTADDLASAPASTSESKSKMDEALAFLRVELANGAMRSTDIEKSAKNAGISTMTLRRARKQICRSIKRSDGWHVELLDPPQKPSVVDLDLDLDETPKSKTKEEIREMLRKHNAQFD